MRPVSSKKKLGARYFKEAAELRAALRRFERRSAEILPARGLTSVQYHLLLVVKTSARDSRGADFIRATGGR